MPRIKKIQKEEKNLDLMIKVYDISGKETGKLELPKEIFSVEVNPILIAQYVRVYLANQRQGNAATRTRSEVTGSTRKIYRQKGTGKARHGDIKAPIFVGGGIVGGPKPRDYSLKINKKQKRKALFSALTLKCKENKIIGLSNDFIKIKPKTKIFANFLNQLKLSKTKNLLVIPKIEKNNLLLAVRNLPNMNFLDATLINAYDILKYNYIFIIEEALTVINKHFLHNEN